MGVRPCISCHAFRGIPWLGGGSLGPDLTHEYARLGGSKGGNRLAGPPPTPTMKSVYSAHAIQPDEAHALAAYLDSLSKQEGGGAARAEKRFLLLGLGGCLIALVAMDTILEKTIQRGTAAPRGR